MIDFTPLWKKELTIEQLVANLTQSDLRRLTNEVVDAMQGLIADCVDADVTFVPHDPSATDAPAETSAEERQGWTLGHVLVHTTASAEEAACSAAEMARGVPVHGRSRYEVPWEEVTTIAQCRQRLEESRRIRLASLELWPDQPHLDITFELPFLDGPINPIARFVLGLMHDEPHIGQIGEIVRQATAARA